MSLTLLVATANPADAFELAAATMDRHVEAGDRVEVAPVRNGTRSHASSIYDGKQEVLDDEPFVANREALLHLWSCLDDGEK